MITLTNDLYTNPLEFADIKHYRNVLELEIEATYIPEVLVGGEGLEICVTLIKTRLHEQRLQDLGVEIHGGPRHAKCD